MDEETEENGSGGELGTVLVDDDELSKSPSHVVNLAIFSHRLLMFVRRRG